MLIAVKNSMHSFISTSEKKGVGYLLNILKDDLSQIDGTMTEILNSNNEHIKRRLIYELILQLIANSSKNSGNSNSVIYESSHPYENNLNVEEVIRIPGAKRLMIKFDP